MPQRSVQTWLKWSDANLGTFNSQMDGLLSPEIQLPPMQAGFNQLNQPVQPQPVQPAYNPATQQPIQPVQPQPVQPAYDPAPLQPIQPVQPQPCTSADKSSSAIDKVGRFFP